MGKRKLKLGKLKAEMGKTGELDLLYFCFLLFAFSWTAWRNNQTR
jgi:hypothetical protein